MIINCVISREVLARRGNNRTPAPSLTTTTKKYATNSYSSKNVFDLPTTVYTFHLSSDALRAYDVHSANYSNRAKFTYYGSTIGADLTYSISSTQKLSCQPDGTYQAIYAISNLHIRNSGTSEQNFASDRVVSDFTIPLNFTVSNGNVTNTSLTVPSSYQKGAVVMSTSTSSQVTFTQQPICVRPFD